MKSFPYPSAFKGRWQDFRRQEGFALVISLSLMVLLTVIAIGLLTLSTVSLRSSSQGEAAAVARNHARLALMIALGEIQAELGPDRRISAPAAAVIASPKQAHLTGTWDSWRWDPTGSTPPDYSGKRSKFRSWLVSSTDAASLAKPDFPSVDPSGTSAHLVADLLQQSGSTAVKAEKIPTDNGSKLAGKLAWAVFDESTKASIDLSPSPTAPGPGTEMASRFAPDRFRPDVVDPALASLKSPEKLFTLDTAIIPAGAQNAPAFRKRFHDFTTGSLGLLTDAVNGGFKTDLTQLFEATSFPSNAFSAQTLYGSTTAGAPRWNYLYDHYRKYKSITKAPTGTPTYQATNTDLAVTSSGNNLSPSTERLIPAIAKLQILFSVVSHHAHFPDRMQFLNANGVPKGNEQHAVPHIVYEPVITLINPYDVALDLKKLRIRVWDPPVGFRFAKIDKQKNVTAWVRSEMANQFQGLARFNYTDEGNPNARKSFTLVLSDGSSQAAGNSMKLNPGEVKVFSARVEKDWSWAFENQIYYEPRSFFDWGVGRDFGNQDRRTSNAYGVEAVPGWDTRAGLQTDHLSYTGNRPQNTKYDFEVQHNAARGFVSIRMTDDFLVEARAERTTGSSTTIPDFQVDLLAAKNVDPTQDLLRSYKFRFSNLSSEISENPAKPVIARTYNIAQTLQKPNDKTRGLKKPFAVLEMAARTTRDPIDDSKAWLYNNPIVEGAEQNSSSVGAANQSYDVRLLELTSYTSFPGVEIDPATNRGYFGASRTSTEGSSHVPMFRVPTAPATSLGDLIPSNLVAGSRLPRVVHPFGNSRAHPLLPANAVTRSLAGVSALDHSYHLNDSLWDRYYLSSITSYGGGVTTETRSRREVLTGLLDGSRPALNPRLAALSNQLNSTRIAEELDSLSDLDRAKQIGARIGIRGPFNLNSTSLDAWRAVLSSLRDREVTAWQNRVTPNAGTTPFVRTGFPLAAPSDGGANANVLGQIRWAGYRSLSDTEIETLAAAIVTEIRNRGQADQAPALSIAEFVNRRPGPDGSLHSLAGLLQTAIDNSGVNDATHALDSKTLNSATIPNARKLGAVNLPAMNGNSADGAPSTLTQGDLMAALAPVATVRGDTFKIRAYGEATSKDGKSILARAWCEATVQRMPEYIDPIDAPAKAEADLTAANRKFGRRFQIVSFRWLNADEL